MSLRFRNKRKLIYLIELIDTVIGEDESERENESSDSAQGKDCKREKFTWNLLHKNIFPLSKVFSFESKSRSGFFHLLWEQAFYCTPTSNSIYYESWLLNNFRITTDCTEI